MLNKEGISSDLVQVIDSNRIDKEIHQKKPSVVFIEAYWCPVLKLKELQKLHPTVKFIIRNHSKTAFLAQEGIGFDWTFEYIKNGFEVACNNVDTTIDLRLMAISCNLDPVLISYLPNYYFINEENRKNFKNPKNFPKRTLSVGLFGAIRPLKNQVNQALAAIEVAEKFKLNLNLHINTSRVEGNGEPILKSLRSIFKNLNNHRLLEHSWYQHEEFLQLISQMDIVSQVSHSESFNIVSANAIDKNVPAIVSPEIDWINAFRKANPDNVQDIRLSYESVLLMDQYTYTKRILSQRDSLNKYNQNSREIWLNKLK